MGQHKQRDKDRKYMLGTEKELHLELQAASDSEWDPSNRLPGAEHLIKISLTSRTSISSSGAK